MNAATLALNGVHAAFVGHARGLQVCGALPKACFRARLTPNKGMLTTPQVGTMCRWCSWGRMFSVGIDIR